MRAFGSVTIMIYFFLIIIPSFYPIFFCPVWKVKFFKEISFVILHIRDTIAVL